MKKKLLNCLLFVLFACAVMLGFGRLPVNAEAIVEPAGGDHSILLPYVMRDITCQVPGSAYQTLSVLPPPLDGPAESHPDINLDIRGWEEVSAPLTLVDYDGAGDALAPQLDTLFSPPRLPQFTTAYQLYRWDWECGCTAGLDDLWPTSLLGMGVEQGERINLPDSGYNIGGGHDALVLYATHDSLTLKYTREDNIVFGYAIHMENICVEPDLLALYEAANAAGRGNLPALTGGQALGVALTDEVMVAIRDTGTFLDPRSRKDWWLDH